MTVFYLSLYLMIKHLPYTIFFHLYYGIICKCSFKYYRHWKYFFTYTWIFISLIHYYTLKHKCTHLILVLTYVIIHKRQLSWYAVVTFMKVDFIYVHYPSYYICNINICILQMTHTKEFNKLIIPVVLLNLLLTYFENVPLKFWFPFHLITKYKYAVEDIFFPFLILVFVFSLHTQAFTY